MPGGVESELRGVVEGLPHRLTEALILMDDLRPVENFPGVEDCLLFL